MPDLSEGSNTVDVFYSYSHDDEELREELEKHLALLRRNGVIEEWNDRQIGAGTEWAGQINDSLDQADVILLLISSSFIASNYCFDREMRRAMERHDAGDARVIPVILRSCDWHGAPFGKLQALPKDGKPVNSWSDVDEAFTDVAKGIRAVAESFSVRHEPLDQTEISPSSAAQESDVLVEEATIATELIIDRDFDSYSDEDQAKLLHTIQQLLGVGDVKVRKKRRRSVSLTLDLTLEQSERLKLAVKRGDFDDLGVTDIILHDALGGERPDVPTEEPPRYLGTYRVLSKLGRGGMGTVYKAVHSRLKKVVALKILPTDVLHTKQADDRFEREMKAVGRLAHPNIVQVSDAGEIDNKTFLVMEYVDGLDLSQIVQAAGPLPIADACEIIRRSAIGLQHMYGHNLLHLNIKPSNLMLTKEGHVKILGIGVHRRQEEHLTSTDNLSATAGYMSPERIATGHVVGVGADIFSLGAILSYLLCGTLTFSTEIADKRADVPPELVAIVARMLERNPLDRYASPQQVADLLAPFTAGSDLVSLSKRVGSKH